jgi:hypothetical protein
VPAFDAPALEVTVDLDAGREAQILRRHPELQACFSEVLEGTLRDPDLVDQRADRSEIGVVRYWPQLRGGCFVVVVVRVDLDRGSTELRYWIATVYICRKIDTWKSLWESP